MDNHFIYLLCAALAPIVAGLGYIFCKDKYNKEPAGLLAGSFFLGIFSIVPIGIIEETIEAFIQIDSLLPNPLLYAFCNAFVVAACTEECFKMYFLHNYIWKKPEFDERFDGIVYGVFVSLGFACAENLQYVMGFYSIGGALVAYTVSIRRAIFTIPCHFFCGVILGYYLSLAKFERNKKNTKSSYISMGLLYAILFHGIFDFILFYQTAYYYNLGNEKEIADQPIAPALVLFIIFVIFNIIFWKFGRKRIKRLADLLRPNPKDEIPVYITCSSCGTSYSSEQNACPKCNQLAEKSLQDQKDALNQNLHNINEFLSNQDASSPKNPFDM